MLNSRDASNSKDYFTQAQQREEKHITDDNFIRDVSWNAENSRYADNSRVLTTARILKGQLREMGR
jgi:hypothetical protein